MPTNIWDEFDKQIDTKSLAEEVKNSGDAPVYKDVPEGQYEVQIEKMELVKSKQGGKPMASVWFKIISDGEFKGSHMFMNQILEQPFQIHNFNEFMRSLGTDLEITFESYKQYGNLMMDVHEAISGHLEYAVNFSKNNKGYPVYEIEEIFEV